MGEGGQLLSVHPRIRPSRFVVKVRAATVLLGRSGMREIRTHCLWLSKYYWPHLSENDRNGREITTGGLKNDDDVVDDHDNDDDDDGSDGLKTFLALATKIICVITI